MWTRDSEPYPDCLFLQISVPGAVGTSGISSTSSDAAAQSHVDVISQRMAEVHTHTHTHTHTWI